MNADPAAGEPPIDTSLAHYMEERALAIARDKASTAQEREMVARLLDARAGLMRDRGAFVREATAKRHTRGEIYSAARVAAINAMGPSRAAMDGDVRTLYERQPDARSVLATHAKTHFGFGLVSARLLLASNTPDIAGAARRMHEREEAFAAGWVAAIGDPALEAGLRASQLEALKVLRTSTRPMILATQPPQDDFSDDDAQALGKAWNKLDEMAQALGVAPLSQWIALPGEDDAGAPAIQLLPTAQALVHALQDPGRKIPAKRATFAAVSKLRDVLQGLAKGNGRAWFEVDI